MGPTGRPILSMSGYLYDGWRDNSKKWRVIPDVIIDEISSFILGEKSFESLFFRGMYH
jgi:hypothetical protein